MPNSDPLPIVLRYTNISKTFGETPAVSAFSLEVREGETMVLIGPSGCGKTTCLKMANGLATPSSGTVEVFGRPVSNWDLVELRRSIGYVVQRIGLYPHLTVAQNIGLLAKLTGWTRSKISSRTDELLSLVGLGENGLAGKYPRQLSGGQAQRVGVARALMLSPKLLLMDEPFGALDPITRRQMQTEFRTIEEHVKTTILLVTHDMTEVLRLADRTAVMDQGKLVHVGRIEDLRSAPKVDFVREFFDAATGRLE